MELLDEEGMKAKFGFTPKQIIDYKGLRGDDSDNLDGIPGVGDKTAVKLIQKYGDFETILSKADEIGGKLGANLKTYAEQGRQCYRLATMKTDVGFPFTLKDLTYEGYDFALANAFAQKYELKQFLSRLPVALKKGAPAPSSSVSKTVSSFQDIALISPLGVALDVDYDEYHDAPIEGIAISSGESVYYETIEDLRKDEDPQKSLIRSRSSKTSTMARPKSTPSIAKESHSKASKTTCFWPPIFWIVPSRAIPLWFILLSGSTSISKTKRSASSKAAIL
jgi:hypothetical protein